MSQLVLEILTGEVPAIPQRQAAAQLELATAKWLQTTGALFSACRAIHTPRRLVLQLAGLDLTALATPQVTRIKGPKITAAPTAIAGFMTKYGLATTELLQQDNGVYYHEIADQGRDPVQILSQGLEEIIRALPWPKRMKWAHYDVRWIRPIESLLCLFDEQVLPLKLGHLTASNQTRGHRFLHPEAITIESAADYPDCLTQAGVMVDQAERKRTILQTIEELAAPRGLALVDDPALLAEVVDLVEFPVVLLGTIPQNFMHLPREVLATTLRNHQKYLLLEERQTGQLAPHFIIVANSPTPDHGKTIILGNQRVLSARLADAAFFMEQDRHIGLSAYRERLSQLIFHSSCGDMLQKSERIVALASRIAQLVDLDAVAVERAAHLCKADLMSEMVRELPELQGIVGYYHALEAGESLEVCAAIRDHYKPQGPGDQLTTAPVTAAVALADKLDTLSQLFAAGIKPSGSKDPYALRRAAIGILRLISQNRFSLPLVELGLSHEVLDFIAKRVASLNDYPDVDFALIANCLGSAYHSADAPVADSD